MSFFSRKKKTAPPKAAAKAKAAKAADGAADAIPEENEDGGDVEMAETGAPKEDKGEVCEMKRGDYLIHVYIEKAKDIKVPDDGTVDPIFQIESLGQKVFSEAKDDIGGMGEVVWSEHIFIEAKDVEKKEAEEGTIKITLQDKGFFKNSVIGSYEFDLSFIYLMDNHVMLHKWLAFSNPETENYSEITGYCKVSINVTCTGDESVQIEDDDGPEDPEILMPPSLNP